MAKPLNRPIIEVPAHKPTNEASRIASAATAAPRPPMTAARAKPLRRPIRCIRNAAGILASMVEKNWIARGRVASELSSARARPTRPEAAMSRELQLIIRACARASRPTLRLNSRMVGQEYANRSRRTR